MAIVKDPHTLRVPVGTVKVLHTKHSLGVHFHQIDGMDMWDWNKPSDTLHSHSMGDRFILRWEISEREMLATISWRELTEQEVEKIESQKRIRKIFEGVDQYTDRSLREPNDHRADALAYSQISKRGK